MAYTELVRFIKEQLNQGKDAITIRNYLMQKNIAPNAIDAAFDEVFGSNNKASTKSHSNHIQKFVVIGFIILIVGFVGVGVKFYLDLPDRVSTPVIEEPLPQVEKPIENFESSSDKICDFEDSDQKYECYIKKFENNEVQCYNIEDLDEREFCYVAQDLYVLSA